MISIWENMGINKFRRYMKLDKVIKAINESFELGDLVTRDPCQVDGCEQSRTIKTGAGHVCQLHAIRLAVLNDLGIDEIDNEGDE